MDKLNIAYSLKNIPVSQKKSVIESKMVESAEDLFRKMRWKLFHYQNPLCSDKKETFGFKTEQPAPSSPLLQKFEDDLLQELAGIEYKMSSNKLQKDMEKDIKIIKSSDDILTKADKTSNIYKMNPEQYNKLLNSTIFKEYKKSAENNVTKVNTEASKLAKNMGLSDRIDQLSKSTAYVTIKDHKNRFPDKIECRLINPAKSNIGQISKKVVDNINEKVRNITKLKQKYK